MPNNLHPAVASVIEPFRCPVPDSYLVIYRTRRRASVVPPYQYDYSHDHIEDLATAEQYWSEIVRGEWACREAVAIVPCRHGVPIGAQAVR